MPSMKHTNAVALILLAGLTLAGCSSTGTDTAAPTTSASQQAAQQIAAADIETIEDGIAWARSLDDGATADELSAGIDAIGDLVPEQDIWFQTNNEIGSALIQLNADIQAEPDDAGTKVDDLQAIVDDIEAAIEKGNNP